MALQPKAAHPTPREGVAAAAHHTFPNIVARTYAGPQLSARTRRHTTGTRWAKGTNPWIIFAASAFRLLPTDDESAGKRSADVHLQPYRLIAPFSLQQPQPSSEQTMEPSGAPWDFGEANSGVDQGVDF